MAILSSCLNVCRVLFITRLTQACKLDSRRHNIILSDGTLLDGVIVHIRRSMAETTRNPKNVGKALAEPQREYMKCSIVSDCGSPVTSSLSAAPDSCSVHQVTRTLSRDAGVPRSVLGHSRRQHASPFPLSLLDQIQLCAHSHPVLLDGRFIPPRRLDYLSAVGRRRLGCGRACHPGLFFFSWGFFLGATPGTPADSETAPRSAGTESMLSPGKKGPNTGRLAGCQVGWCGLLALGSSCCPEEAAYVSPLVAWLLAAVFLRQTRFRGSGRLGEGSFFVHDQPMRW